MRSLKLALLLLSLSMIGACDNKSASSDPSKSTDSGKSDTSKSNAGKTAPPPVTDPNQKSTPTQTAPPPIAKPTSGSGKPYTLRINEKAGSAWDYTYSVKTFADPSGMTADNPQRKSLPEYSTAEVTGKVHMQVVSVKDGKTTFKKTASVTKSLGTGAWKKQADELGKKGPDVATYTWDERMSNVNIGKGELYDIMTNSLHTLFPKEPVQIGSTWEYHPIPDAPENSKAKLEAQETVDGVSTLRINVAFPAAAGESNTVKVWIDPTNGRYIKIQMDSVGNSNGLKSENHLVQELKK